MVMKEARLHTTRHAVTATVTDIPLNCEATAYCPACTAFETVWFVNGHLMATQKFTELGHCLYHACGTSLPCRLYSAR